MLHFDDKTSLKVDATSEALKTCKYILGTKSVAHCTLSARYRMSYYYFSDRMFDWSSSHFYCLNHVGIPVCDSLTKVQHSQHNLHFFSMHLFGPI